MDGNSLLLLAVMFYFVVACSLKGGNMKTEKEFEETCRMMLEDRWSCNAMPEMSADVQNMFYDNFGMSAEEINEVLCGRKRMD